jgi:5-methylcytosine-specific restriction protein A
MMLEVGESYTRSAILSAAGLADAPDIDLLGDCLRRDDDWFIISTIGAVPDLASGAEARFEDGRFYWSATPGMTAKDSSIQSMIFTPGRVLIFTRMDDRDPFMFMGFGQPFEIRDTNPVSILWDLRETPATVPPLADEVSENIPLTEGTVFRVGVNRYERSAYARQVCLDHYGAICAVCDLRFEVIYGPMGRGYIHVHHLIPLALIGREYVVDPVRHLRPVCPNCHAMLHMEDPPMTIEKLRSIVEKSRTST